MNFDFQSDSSTKYIQVYEYYKELITTGRLPEHTKIPSIRKCAQQLGLSRTTIETAYLCLAADGYIIARPQSGYYVTARETNKQKLQNTTISAATSHPKQPYNPILYNFTSNNVDADSFDFNLWRRYIKSTLRHDKRMLTYGESQGEYELRETLCNYVINKRNAACCPENIVIGAGSQALLNILCPLIKDRQSVCFHDTHFAQGMVIFQDYGFEIKKEWEAAGVLYMTPSHMTSFGDTLAPEKRQPFLKKCQAQNQLIIEDDYNNEFRYFNRPTPCLQGLSGGKNVVYLSTFSKLLLPSIRLSFMILPDELLPFYEQKKALYNQTASKSEQLALCQFLRDGHLDSQIRKLKRLYTNKAKALSSLLEEAFGENAIVFMGESVFMVHIKLNCGLTSQQLQKKAQENGILVFSCDPQAEPRKNSAEIGNTYSAHIALSCCEVPVTEFPEAVQRFKQAAGI